MRTFKIFIASSSELKEDREQFRIFISKENDRLHKKEIYLEIKQWENFLDAISDTRLQDEYNNSIRGCDIVLCLFFTKVGKYSAEEFDTAYKVFKDTGKPRIWTYFKNAQINTGSITEEINTLIAFKKKISELGHFHSAYTNIDNLINEFRSQLDEFLPEGVREVDTSIDKPSEELPEPSFKFNDLLTKKLIESIKPFNKKASDFLINNNGWESNPSLLATAKRIVFTSYVGILGIQLRKIMSIGEEDYSTSQLKRYLENCLYASKRALQLICFSLLSRMWDAKLRIDFALSSEQSTVISKFFKNAAEDSTIGYANLMIKLIDVFVSNKIELPFPQLAAIQSNLNKDFMEACNVLQSISDLLNRTEVKIEDCAKAELNLTVILEHLSFLVEYKMVSLKDIDFAIQRNDTEGMYLHYYTLLDGDSQTNNSNFGKVKKEIFPVISFSVLLCKDNLRQNINLAPFIIDYNALSLVGGSKICIFSFYNTFESDFSLNYIFIDDNTKVILKKSQNRMPDVKDDVSINKWLADPKNRIDMNFDKIFQLFQDAKKTIVGIGEETIETGGL
jgi:hypothetical protein